MKTRTEQQRSIHAVGRVCARACARVRLRSERVPGGVVGSVWRAIGTMTCWVASCSLAELLHGGVRTLSFEIVYDNVGVANRSQ